MPPKALFHWSRKSLDVFSNSLQKFEVRTQGHVYALDSLDNKSGATSRFEAMSLIVFTEQAADLFVKHPFITIMFWKRLYKQFWSNSFLKDVSWKPSDAFRCGEVLVIRKAEFVSITVWRRILGQLARRGAILAIDLFLLAIIIDVVISVNTDWGVIRWLSPNPSTSTLISIMVAGVTAVAITMCFMRVGKAKKADGTEWDYRKELECALQMAEEARLQENTSNARA